jgi:threonine dehydrogenase-like Zn-dependent dehydrogenase
MKAAFMRAGAIEVGELPDPTPGRGEVLVRTLACGVCASDLHVLHHGQELVDWSRAEGGPFHMDLARPVVLGHEYCAEILDYGPGSERPYRAGTKVTSSPVVIGETGIFGVGLSNEYPGGFGELMVLSESLLRPVPDSIDADTAALTEPVSVGTYYVRAAALGKTDVPLVVGCGAIGLAVIGALRRADARPIIAADLSATRREHALRMGADIVVDPAETSPYAAVPGAPMAANVIFECVGVPGVLDGVLRGAAWGARILVAGWCLETDRVFTPPAHTKGLTVKFGGGPLPEDFDVALRALGDGEIDIDSWISGEVGLDGVADALERLRDPSAGLRTLVRPDLDAVSVRPLP